MKKLGLLIFLLFTATGFAFSQKEEGEVVEKRMREVQEFKMKYLAQEMELSEAQKKKFYEVYGEMMQSRTQCFRSARMLEKKVKRDKDATEQEYQQATDAINKANAEWAETEKAYNDKLSEFLTQKQIYKMREAEASFRAKFEELKHSRQKEFHKKKDDKK